MALIPSLPEVVRAMRVRSGLTMAEFAARLGVNQSSISRWEAGVVPPARGALLTLLTYAEGLEKGVISNALGVVPSPQDAMEIDAARPSKPGLREFAQISREILRRDRDVDRYILDLLRAWISAAPAESDNGFLGRAKQFVSTASPEQIEQVESLMTIFSDMKEGTRPEARTRKTG